ALCKGDYKDTVKEQPGSASVVQGVTEDKYAIGYSGIGYKTSGVRAVPVGAKPGQCVDDSAENVLSGKYPLARFLYVYVNKAPNKPFDPLVREFLKFVLSQQGQQTVVKDGLIPLTTKIVQEELAKLQSDRARARWPGCGVPPRGRSFRSGLLKSCPYREISGEPPAHGETGRQLG